MQKRRKKSKGHRKFVRKAAALNFEPMDFGDLTQFNNDTFQQIGISVRVAAVLLASTKGKMLDLARTRGCDAWFEFLDQLHDASKDVAGLQQMLTTAHARGIAVAAVMAKEETAKAA